MNSNSAIELQKVWDWSGAKTLWQGATGDYALHDFNLAICNSWLGDCEAVLEILDRYESGRRVPPELSSLSDTHITMLRRSLLVVELYAADQAGEPNRASRCIEELAALGGGVHELARTPVAIVCQGGEFDVLEDVVHVGDLLIPLTVYCGGLRRNPSDAAQRMTQLYSMLRRDDLEPLRTNKERISAALGLPDENETRIFRPMEWQGRGIVTEADLLEELPTADSSGFAGSSEAIDDFWPGFRQQLKEAFHTLVEEEARPEREESVAEYAKLYHMVKDFASFLPYCRVLMRAGTSLYRARIVGHAGCEHDISYPPEPHFVREFGRVNAPEESIFYSANDARTAVAEVLNTWFDTAQAGEARQVFAGRWVATRDLEGALVPYHDEALALSPIRHSVTREMERLRQQYAPKTYQLVRDCLAYLGSVFARKARSPLDYWTTTAYFNFVTNPRNFEQSGQSAAAGLFYPSVQMKYRGDNFATFPEVVRSALQCIDASSLQFRCLGGGRFCFEGKTPRWFSKLGRQFGF